MRKDWTAPLDAVNFVCTVCRAHWQARPDLVEPDEQAQHHPYRYFATCEVCEARNQPQAQWERALMKAHQAATGPKTAEGKAAAAANLAGHPTPDEALRTRFNAMKHGMNARVARYFPAKPDGYAFCQGCDVNRRWCQEQPACVKQTELFMLTSAAFEQRDPRILGKVHSDLHAALVASLQMCLQAVLGDGAVIKTPKLEWVQDKEGGGSHVAVCYVDGSGETRYVYDYQANPAFKPIADLVTRLGLSLSDLGMTVQAADEEQNQLRGRLPAQQAAAGDTLEAFAQRTAAALENLGSTIKAARAAAERDPVLLEHQAQTGTGEPAPLGVAMGGKP